MLHPSAEENISGNTEMTVKCMALLSILLELEKSLRKINDHAAVS